MTTTKQEPIKGWVAWHPTEGEIPIAFCLNKEFCETGLLNRLEQTSISPDGWIIRPVELRFTDKGEG